jgi:alkaline phosphatase
MRYLLLLLLLPAFFSSTGQAQLALSRIHAHNDYQKMIPFYEAYRLGAGSIEVDIALRNGELYVAHEIDEIRKENTLDSLYLRPLEKIAQRKTDIACSSSKQNDNILQLLIDIKTAPEETMDVLVQKLISYPPEVFSKNRNIIIAVSGNVPAPAKWSAYPSFIHFDGRPGITYSDEQLKRVALISDDFSKYSSWNGKGLIPAGEKAKVQALINSVHGLGKKIRFWATPDQINAWNVLFSMDVDFVGTDYVYLLREYIKKQQSREYTNSLPSHIPYSPKYLNNDKRTKVRNVILMIGDGMGLAQIYSGYTGNRGALNLFNMINIGFAVTTSADSYITDSAAGGTAMATGKKTNNRYIGIDSNGHDLISLPQVIRKYGIHSALISAGDITDATPAAFYAHQTERSNNDAIALDFLSNPVNILIGGGPTHFSKRADGQNLFSKLRDDGYLVVNDLKSMDTISAKKFILLDDKASLSVEKGRGDFLVESLKKCMFTLKQNKNGFFVMAEGAQIDYGGHDNRMNYVVREMIDFDLAIGEAMRFSDSNGETLVIVTADHETGGLTLLEGDISKGYVGGNFSTPDHSAVMVPVFAYGPHSQDFRGVYQNTEIFQKILRILELYHN